MGETTSITNASRRDRDVIDIAWVGRITPADVVRVRLTVDRLLSLQPARIVVADTSACAGFDAQAREAGRDLVELLRERGIELLVAVSPSLLVRLAGTGIALSCRVPIELVKDVAEAHAVVSRALLREAAGASARRRA